jgi:predicted transcriptional regulator
MNENLIKQAILVKKVVDENYIPNSHYGCEIDIYRKIIRNTYPMSVSKFRRLLKIARENPDAYPNLTPWYADREIRLQKKRVFLNLNFPEDDTERV